MKITIYTLDMYCDVEGCESHKRFENESNMSNNLDDAHEEGWIEIGKYEVCSDCFNSAKQLIFKKE